MVLCRALPGTAWDPPRHFVKPSQMLHQDFQGVSQGSSRHCSGLSGIAQSSFRHCAGLLKVLHGNLAGNVQGFSMCWTVFFQALRMDLPGIGHSSPRCFNKLPKIFCGSLAGAAQDFLMSFAILFKTLQEAHRELCRTLPGTAPDSLRCCVQLWQVLCGTALGVAQHCSGLSQVLCKPLASTEPDSYKCCVALWQALHKSSQDVTQGPFGVARVLLGLS